jgi:hypothetical protein
VGSASRKTRGRPMSGKCSEGKSPKSAAGMKQGRLGLAGRKPSRGFRNPEDGTSRAGKARDLWARFSHTCSQGRESPQELLSSCGSVARFRWAILYEEPKLEERMRLNT